MDRSVLLKIAAVFNGEGILWAVGGSLLLNQYGLGSPANDIDLLVALPDAEKAGGLLKCLGTEKAGKPDETYGTLHFREYVIRGTEVDLMSGLRISHPLGCYVYPFQSDSIAFRIQAEETEIPMMALEDWYVLYQLMPNRENKVKLIESLLLSRGINRPDLLERACRGCLPDAVRKRIENLQGNSGEGGTNGESDITH